MSLVSPSLVTKERAASTVSPTNEDRVETVSSATDEAATAA
jgi:hypothetical protein